MESLVRPMTLVAIVGLLMSVGLKVSVDQILAAARDRPLVVRSLVANFLIAPVVILAIAILFDLPTDISIGMVLVASAPFAPMAPAFAGVARGNLPMAAGHLVIYSILAAVTVPLLCRVMFAALPGAGNVELDTLALVKSLIVSVFVPLAVGLGINTFAPGVAARLLHPVQVIAQTVLLALVAMLIYLQFEVLKDLGLRVLLALALATEIPLWIGYYVGGPGEDTRRSLAMGTGVRNMGIAMLIATGAFADSPALITVIAYALVMIILGLAHAHYWERSEPATGSLQAPA